MLVAVLRRRQELQFEGDLAGLSQGYERQHRQQLFQRERHQLQHTSFQGELPLSIFTRYEVRRAHKCEESFLKWAVKGQITLCLIQIKRARSVVGGTITR